MKKIVLMMALMGSLLLVSGCESEADHRDYRYHHEHTVEHFLGLIKHGHVVDGLDEADIFEHEAGDIGRDAGGQLADEGLRGETYALGAPAGLEFEVVHAVGDHGARLGRPQHLGKIQTALLGSIAPVPTRCWVMA